jgi:N-acetylglucosamine transport system substrate-binding protein
MRRQLLTLVTVALFSAGCTVRPLGGDRRTTLEVAVFEGGYGIEWHKQVARAYERLHPDIKVNLWGDPRVDEKLKPRVLRRDPPDLANCNLPVWKLIVAGKLYPLDTELATQAVGQTCSWRDSLEHGILDNYVYQGRTYAIPSNVTGWVYWYDKRMFRQHGWKPPRTWSEFTALCDQIKAAGIAPIAFQGKYPTYAWAAVLSIYQRLVPFSQWEHTESMAPDAFDNPEFIHASRLMQDLAVKYFEPGALAMTHTESQLEWVNGRAALVYCGFWLKNEMKNAIPPGFEMSCFALPAVEGGKGDPHALYGEGAEDFFIFSEAKHPREAADFLKFMLSMQSAHSYVNQLDTLSPVRDSTKGLTLSPDLQSAVDIVSQRSRFFSDRLTGLYPTFGNTAVRDGLADLLSGKSTPEAFAKRLQAGLEEIKRDPDIFKPPIGSTP